MIEQELCPIGTMERLRRCEEALTTLWNDVDRVRANLESRSRFQAAGIGDAFAENDTLLARVRELETERDAANARAESARVDALEEAASYVDTIPPRYPDRQDQYCKGAGETAEYIADRIRALKEAAK